MSDCTRVVSDAKSVRSDGRSVVSDAKTPQVRLAGLDHPLRDRLLSWVTGIAIVGGRLGLID